MLTPKGTAQGSASPANLLRLVAVGAVILAAALIPAWLLSIPSIPRDPEVPLCTCHAAKEARDDFQAFREALMQDDAAVALAPNVSLGPLQRVVRRQRQLILDQAAEILRLREAARARDLHLPVAAVQQKKYTVFRVEEHQPATWRQHTFQKHAAFGFVQFSSYRLSPQMIVVVGLGHFLSRGARRLGGCWWVWDDEREVKGQLTLDSMEEHHRFLYELLILNCTFSPKDMPSMELEETTAKGTAKMYHSKMGGHLRVKLDQEVFYPYREWEGYKIRKEDSDGPFQYERLFCGPPMFGDFQIPSVTQFISYHRFHAGIQHFILYDSGSVTHRFREILSPLVADGFVTITDFREALQYDTWAQNQALGMHDCLYRSREIARWVFFHDLDEYVEVPAPLTLTSLLARHRHAPYMTHGCIMYSVDNCEEPNVWDPLHNKFAVELLVHRWVLPYCTAPGLYNRSMCLNYHGHRKMIQNPRKVIRTYVHVPDPEGGGVDLPIEDIRHAHYRSLFNPTRPCGGQVEKGGHIMQETTVAQIAAQARACAKENFANEERCQPKTEDKS